MTKLSEEAKALIKDTHPGFIATASASGRPNVSLKGSLRVLDDEHIVFADIHSPNTIANLVENPLVARDGLRTLHTARLPGLGRRRNPFFRRVV